MSDTPDLYTPTDEEVRERYIASEPGYMRDPLKPSDPDYEVTGQEFDRWLTAHDARVRAEAQAEQREADAAKASETSWGGDYGNGADGRWYPMSDARDKAEALLKPHVLRVTQKTDYGFIEKSVVPYWDVVRILDAAVAARPVPDREAVARAIYDIFPSRHPVGYERFKFDHASANNERAAAYRAADAILSLLTPDTNPTTEED